MAQIFVFPGGISPHRTALSLELRGYRINPLTGRAVPFDRPLSSAERMAHSVAPSLIGRAPATQHRSGDHDLPPAA